MTDFYQHRVISTLHHLADPDLDVMESTLAEHARRQPIALILPALYSEVKQPALSRIVDELSKVSYLQEIVISMNRMDAREFEHAKEFLSQLPQNHRIIWNDGPRMLEIYKELADAHLTSYVPGKGYNVWMAYGYILAKGTARMIATHDSDILSYHREMLVRLCMPTAHPNLGYEYSKSYYGRVSDRMYGRVTRLFVAPLLRAMMRAVGRHPLLEYLNDFRYPLSGEFSLGTELAKVIRIPGDWGLEIGMLCEIYRNTTTRRICQVDLGYNFEHKHQHLGAEPQDPNPSPSKGLMKMAHDIALSLFHNMSSEGVVLSRSMLKAIDNTYTRIAKESIRRYYDDAIINGLKYFRHEEAAAVDAFSIALEKASQEFYKGAYTPPNIPNWNRVFSALPDLEEKLVEIVEADNAS